MRREQLQSRRKFIKKGGILTLGMMGGMVASGAGNSHWFKGPIAMPKLPGKHLDLIVLNERPVNAETPAHLLDHSFTPNDLFFVRNNGIPPEVNASAVANWTLEVDGEGAQQKQSWSIEKLKSEFEVVTLAITLECGGNGRKEFNPPASGNQWGVGAVGCAKWTGVRLRDVLQKVGIKSNAVYIGYYGKDTHISGDASKIPISRGVPIEKALEPECLIAWEMNGQPLPALNGYPLRLVIGGYPASTSGKWLYKISIRDQVHDGPKMEAPSYRVPCKPVAPGTKVPNEEMCIIESMPVKSLITYPRTGATISVSKKLPMRGHAWGGVEEVKAVQYSIDYGSTWEECNLNPPLNKFAWQDFNAQITFPSSGYYEVWVKATDAEGNAQPMVMPNWNPKGYLNNACHRIAVKITA